ncbi:MAG: DNA/RNA non-specific endonuclease [Prevotella sp.]|nr:DNA/RNA non-specific endonuclease [Prevotella sp.]
MRPLRAGHLLLLVLLLVACHDTDDNDYWGEQEKANTNVNGNDASLEPSLARLEFPKVKGGTSVILIHTTNDQFGINYSVEWDTEKKAQRWSAYQMNRSTLKQSTTRYRSDTNQYPNDPQLPDNQYLSQDCFWNSGYDHGHICPSADRLYSAEANYQTFFLTNMQPQYPKFNASDNSPWYRLEGTVRSWANATTTEMLYVVKGGTIEDDQILATKVKGEMRVPKYFFVALLLKNAEGYKAIGFWMEHKSTFLTQEPLKNFATNIRDLEARTGIDFFCNLPDNTENHVETLPVENVCRAWGL